MTSVSATILRGFKWCVAHWYIPLTALAAILGWFIGSRRHHPTEVIADELETIKRGQEVERFAADKGAQIANEVIDQEYRRDLQRLSQQQKDRAESLRRSPGRRIRYLRRLSKRLGEPPRDR